MQNKHLKIEFNVHLKPKKQKGNAFFLNTASVDLPFRLKQLVLICSFMALQSSSTSPNEGDWDTANERTHVARLK